jgi:hypothetical protein
MNQFRHRGHIRIIYSNRLGFLFLKIIFISVMSFQGTDRLDIDVRTMAENDLYYKFCQMQNSI